jgi:hypothetical protein
VTETTTARTRQVRAWAKRLGAVAVLFFAFKGLLWIAVPAWLLVRGCGG